MSNFWYQFGPVVIVIAILICVVLGVPYIGNRMVFPGQMAEIEQLREDASKIDIQKSEDIYGQVTEVNQAIKSNQIYNKIWWAKWVVVDGWDDVEFISVEGK